MSVLWFACPAEDAARPIVYVSGEETLSQIKTRANRLRVSSSQLHLLTETNLDAIFATLDRNKPPGGYLAVFIDSIQTLESNRGLGVSGGISHVCLKCAVLLL